MKMADEALNLDTFTVIVPRHTIPLTEKINVMGLEYYLSNKIW